MSHANAALFAALSKAQSEVESADKDSFNQHARYKFTSNEEMTRVSRGPLGRNGLSVMTPVWDVIDPIRPDSLGVLVTPWVLTHSEGGYITGQAMMDVIASKRNRSDKQIAAALSYLKTYILKGVLNMDRMEDAANTVDGRDESQMGGYQHQRRPQQRREPPKPIVDERKQALRKAMQVAATELVELSSELGGSAVPSRVAGEAVHPGEEWNRERDYSYEDYEKGIQALKDKASALQEMADADAAMEGDDA